MSYCPYCKEEACAVPVGDCDYIDWCNYCDVCIEGETLDHIGGDDE